MTISVCIVDDNKDIRSALEQIIMMAEGYTLAGSFADAEEALLKIPLAKPNVVLMDINLGDGESGIDCVRQLKPLYPEILFMMCTIYEEDEKIFEALTAGANGYILKKNGPRQTPGCSPGAIRRRGSHEQSDRPQGGERFPGDRRLSTRSEPGRQVHQYPLQPGK